MQAGMIHGDKFLLGAALLLALVLGGNTAPGYWIDQAIQFAMIMAAAVVIWRNPERQTDWRLRLILLAIVSAVALQLIPLPATLVDPLQNIVARLDPALAPQPAFRPSSLAIGRTLDALSWVLACSIYAVAVTKLRFEDAYGLVPIFLVGVVIHLVAALLQYSASSAGGGNLAGFVPRAGFFANINHFSALVFISIPLAFAYAFDHRRLSGFLVYLSVALLILLAAGSRAGVMIGLAVTVLSALILFRRAAFGAVALLCGAALGGVYALGVWARLSREGLVPSQRSEFAATTWDGILDNPFFGIGYGGFVTAYPAYEKTQDIGRTYVNHTHNDFLELIFEGGLVAAILLAAALAMLAFRAAKTLRWPLHYACAIALFFLLLHSAVDYPMRTMAISTSFCLLVAILFHTGAGEVSCRLGDAGRKPTRERKSAGSGRTRKRRSRALAD